MAQPAPCDTAVGTQSSAASGTTEGNVLRSLWTAAGSPRFAGRYVFNGNGKLKKSHALSSTNQKGCIPTGKNISISIFKMLY